MLLGRENTFTYGTISYLSKKNLTGKGTCAAQTSVVHRSTVYLWQNYVGLPGNT